MNSNMLVRLAGLIGGGLVGWSIAAYLRGVAGGLDTTLQLAVALAVALMGLVVAPYITTAPLRWVRRRLKALAAPDILAATIGLILGLVVAALLAIPLSQLPDNLGRLLPSAGAVICGYLGIYLMVMRRSEFLDLLGGVSLTREGREPPAAKRDEPEQKYILVDTSAIIDGRIADISQTGFLDGVLLIPRFVLNELQRIADSPDSLNRKRLEPA